MQLSDPDHHIDILVSGYPGKSVCHGSLGWSTIALVRNGTRIGLIDVGSFGQRKLIHERLAERGLQRSDISDVLLTHSHYDHALNWVMFPRARIVLGGEEMDWSVQVPWGEGPVPELYVRELAGSAQLVRALDGDSVFPGITAHLAPGHTPGHLVYVLHGAERDVIFTGDAAKNRAELLSRSADMSYDASISRASIEGIWDLWRARPGNVLVPGHDLPMRLHDGEPAYMGEREAHVQAWFGDGLEQVTRIEMTA